jgi:hypothetical protein
LYTAAGRSVNNEEAGRRRGLLPEEDTTNGKEDGDVTL